jgi:hypothetical protein
VLRCAGVQEVEEDGEGEEYYYPNHKNHAVAIASAAFLVFLAPLVVSFDGFI